MAKTKQQKAEIVERLSERINRAKVLVFTSFSRKGKGGLNVKAMEELKRGLKESDSEYVVLKKTLLDLALQKFSFADQMKVKELDGSIAVLFGYRDIIEPLKILHQTSKGNEAMELYSGLTTQDKQIFSKDYLVELANLPSRDVLLGQMAGMISYPLSGLANVLQGNIRGLAAALSQIKK